MMKKSDNRIKSVKQSIIEIQVTIHAYRFAKIYCLIKKSGRRHLSLNVKMLNELNEGSAFTNDAMVIYRPNYYSFSLKKKIAIFSQCVPLQACISQFLICIFHAV